MLALPGPGRAHNGTSGQREIAVNEESVTIDAPVEQVWDLVTDVTKMGRFSPGNTGGKWLGGAKEPSVGAKFIGFNRRGVIRWATRCTVTECEEPNRFAFQVTENNMQWGWRLEPAGSGTRLIQWRDRVKEPAAPIRVVANLLFRGNLEGEMADGMRETLAKVKTVAENGSAPSA